MSSKAEAQDNDKGIRDFGIESTDDNTKVNTGKTYINNNSEISSDFTIEH